MPNSANYVATVETIFLINTVIPIIFKENHHDM